LDKRKEEMILLEKGDTGRHVVLLGFKRVTIIPFLKSRIAQEGTFNSMGKEFTQPWRQIMNKHTQPNM